MKILALHSCIYRWDEGKWIRENVIEVGIFLRNFNGTVSEGALHGSGIDWDRWNRRHGSWKVRKTYMKIFITTLQDFSS